jgi:L-alanine-DL-glutamate epimerase-like enolase superfamily enzyme
MRITSFRITRFQFLRDRVIGDSQVAIDQLHAGTLELIGEKGTVGLGFFGSLFHPLPALAEIERIFREEVWPGLEGQEPGALVHRVTKPRGGNRRGMSLPFGEAVQQALWDLFAKDLGMPLSRLLGATRDRVRAYASGLCYHLSDDEFSAFFARANELGYSAFKIKVGHPDVEWDLNRLRLLVKAVRKDALIMVDANEAWSAKEALMRLDVYRRAGRELLWVEDPIPRDDFIGLKMLRDSAPWTQINSGEYLDLQGKMALLQAEGADILNVHGPVTDVMRVGWYAATRNIPVSLGNTFLELGINMAVALPGVEWLEYSFQNYNHLVDEPIEIRDGYAYAPQRPGHGLVLSETTRREWAVADVIPRAAMKLP